MPPGWQGWQGCERGTKGKGTHRPDVRGAAGPRLLLLEVLLLLETRLELRRHRRHRHGQVRRAVGLPGGNAGEQTPTLLCFVPWGHRRRILPDRNTEGTPVD